MFCEKMNDETNGSNHHPSFFSLMDSFECCLANIILCVCLKCVNVEIYNYLSNLK